jgi:hypothetical protein
MLSQFSCRGLEVHFTTRASTATETKKASITPLKWACDQILYHAEMLTAKGISRGTAACPINTWELLSWSVA